MVRRGHGKGTLPSPSSGKMNPKREEKVIMVVDDKQRSRRKEKGARKSSKSPRFNSDQQMMLANEYGLTLIDPFNYKSVAHIPDLDLHPSVLFTLVKRTNGVIQTPAGSATIGGLCVGMYPIPGQTGVGSIVPVPIRTATTPAADVLPKYPPRS